jgi:hypothetical protein
MGRIRSIKPEFFTSEDIVALSPFARLLYISLWCEADREGRLVWKPVTFKLRYFPADDLSINDLCEELLGKKLIVRYGDGFAYIPTFKEHQHINPREKESSLPDQKIDASSTRHSRVSDGENTRREERKGKEGDIHASEDAAKPSKPAFDIRHELESRGVDPQICEDWIKHRKAKKASITLTVLKEHIAEADKAFLPLAKALAYACNANWQAFKAEWYFNREKTNGNRTIADEDLYSQFDGLK